MIQTFLCHHQQQSEKIKKANSIQRWFFRVSYQYDYSVATFVSVFQFNRFPPPNKIYFFFLSYFYPWMFLIPTILDLYLCIYWVNNKRTKPWVFWASFAHHMYIQWYIALCKDIHYHALGFISMRINATVIELSSSLTYTLQL